VAHAAVDMLSLKCNLCVLHNNGDGLSGVIADMLGDVVLVQVGCICAKRSIACCLVCCVKAVRVCVCVGGGSACVIRLISRPMCCGSAK
jgi:23S rRNA G2069 N7-methylase RlmK/C1962 C5-methylase RlmI